MLNQFDQTLKTLEGFLSPAVARALLTRVARDHGATANTLTKADLARMGEALRRGVAMFIDARRRDEADRIIAAHCGGEALPDGVSLSITGEFEIGKIRAETRRVCTNCGANAFAMQKVATVVSELARNMVLYAGGGHLDVTAKRAGNRNGQAPFRIVVVATDRGPGIPNLQEILAGNYQSRTGLGRGLLGTKRLAEHFDVRTGPDGTRIVAEIAL